MALGIVPMCSNQMERMFNTTRIPGKETGTAIASVVSRQEDPLPSRLWAATARSCHLLVTSTPAVSGCNCQDGQFFVFFTKTSRLLLTGMTLVLGPQVPTAGLPYRAGLQSEEHSEGCCCP